ncbi:MAG: hypothetical protein ACLPXT_04810 [Terracidiphilus sp.]
MNWIDDFTNTVKDKKLSEAKRDEIRLHKHELLKERFPMFWEELTKQVDKDCSQFKVKLPDDISYHIRKDDLSMGGLLPCGGFKLTREAAPPYRQLIIQPTIEAECIDISGGHMNQSIEMSITDDNGLVFTWEGKNYTTQEELSAALIKYCLSSK